MQYRMNAGGRNGQVCLYLTVCHMTILHYQFTHVLWHNVYWIRLWVSVGHDWVNLLRSAFSTDNFRWICLVFEDSHVWLLYYFGLIRLGPWFNIFWSRDRIDTSLFERLCGIHRNQFIFTAESHAISNVCWWKKSPRMRYLTCIISSRTEQWQRQFLDDVHGIRLWVSVGRDWFH